MSTTAWGHGSYKLFVQRLDPSRPLPAIDGSVLDGEYGTLVNAIFYRPRLDIDPALVRLVATETDLYVSIARMPASGTRADSFVSISIDTDHNGGSQPDYGDLQFLIRKNHTRATLRGDGSGSFAPAPELDASWEGRDGPRTEFPEHWAAEFRIPLSLIGGGPSPSVGIHIRHNWLRFVGDDFAVDRTGIWNVPKTWEDLVWLGPSRSEKISVDVLRVTQGLEVDTTGGVNFDLIPGKDTLVRAQLYTTGPLRTIVSAKCRLQRLATGVGSGAIPAGPVVTLPVEMVPAPKINPYPAGYFNGSAVVNCWIDGTNLATASATYHFELELQLDGGSGTQIVNLGNHLFSQSADLQLGIFPWILPTEFPNYSPWPAGSLGALAAALDETHRMLPVRRGVSSLFRSGSPEPGAAGLRYILFPGRKSPPAGTTNLTAITNFVDAEYLRARTDATLALEKFNADVRALNKADGLRRDLLDRAIMPVPVASLTGGQVRPETPLVASSDFTTSDVTGFLFAHELSHTLGQIRGTTSPHVALFDGCLCHAKTDLIPAYRAARMVHMLMRTDIADAAALMGIKVVGSPQPQNNYHEGWEWNDVRRTLLETEAAAAMGGAGKSTAEGGEVIAPRFLLTGRIDRGNLFVPDFSARIDDQELPLTPPAPNSAYALVFRNSAGTELSRLPFNVRFDSTEGEDDWSGVFLVALLPPGTDRIEIRHAGALLHALNVSSAAPTVDNVMVTPDPANADQLNLQWSAGDADSAQLAYSIYFVPHAGAIPMLVVSGQTGDRYTFPTDMVAPTADGRLIVEASDGYNTARRTSAPFNIRSKPPGVAISSPKTNATLVAGQRITLWGSGLDLTDGQLSGRALSWSSDRVGILGTGNQLDVTLAAGTHRLTLLGTAASGLTGSHTVEVVVLADTDGDSLPDVSESQLPCLSPSIFDSDLDPDGDGLTSLAEILLGTNPCLPDSDGDGLGDGDEERLGSHPSNAQSLPLPDLLYVSSETVELSACPAAVATTIPVATSNPQTSWTVASDSDWLAVSGGGIGDGQVVVQAQPDALPPGDYWSQLFLRTAGGQLRILDVHLVVSPSEANNTPGTAMELDLRSGGATVKGGICPAGDADYYRFTAPAATKVWITVDSGGPQEPGANSRDSFVELLASDGTTLIEADDDDGSGNGCDSTTESTAASVIGGRVLTAGATYFVKVRDYSPMGVIKPYTLFMALTDTGVRPEVESNDTPALADQVVGTTPSINHRNGVISQQGDIDYYSVVVTAPTILHIVADADPLRAGGIDLTVDLLAPNGTTVLYAANSSGPGGLMDPAAEGFCYAVTTPGNYYLRVTGLGGAPNAPYDLMVAKKVLRAETFLRIVSATVVNGQFHVTFPTVQGRTYTIEGTDSLNPEQGWMPVSGNSTVSGTGGMVDYNVGAIGSPAMFIRVRENP